MNKEHTSSNFLPELFHRPLMLNVELGEENNSWESQGIMNVEQAIERITREPWGESEKRLRELLTSDESLALADIAETGFNLFAKGLEVELYVGGFEENWFEIMLSVFEDEKMTVDISADGLTLDQVIEVVRAIYRQQYSEVETLVQRTHDRTSTLKQMLEDREQAIEKKEMNTNIKSLLSMLLLALVAYLLIRFVNK